ncbi:PREDICTED: uncharacterized protein LOC105570340 [Vollenhovia emeryi]|uniref:uncharacterized protein LOC105570340 n=1 Tax=Vollenhovia emeryi TaxID=411798 RepID=UPI0005F3AF14|nr:PREDICTED: uncharacterized protein LOC105570340 [Vollenhovia emeryi]
MEFYEINSRRDEVDSVFHATENHNVRDALRWSVRKTQNAATGITYSRRSDGGSNDGDIRGSSGSNDEREIGQERRACAAPRRALLRDTPESRRHRTRNRARAKTARHLDAHLYTTLPSSENCSTSSDIVTKKMETTAENTLNAEGKGNRAETRI